MQSEMSALPQRYLLILTLNVQTGLLNVLEGRLSKNIFFCTCTHCLMAAAHSPSLENTRTPASFLKIWKLRPRKAKCFVQVYSQKVGSNSAESHISGWLHWCLLGKLRLSACSQWPAGPESRAPPSHTQSSWTMERFHGEQRILPAQERSGASQACLETEPGPKSFSESHESHPSICISSWTTSLKCFWTLERLTLCVSNLPLHTHTLYSGPIFLVIFLRHWLLFSTFTKFIYRKLLLGVVLLLYFLNIRRIQNRQLPEVLWLPNLREQNQCLLDQQHLPQTTGS